jgi:hypothetical protein
VVGEAQLRHFPSKGLKVLQRALTSAQTPLLSHCRAPQGLSRKQTPWKRKYPAMHCRQRPVALSREVQTVLLESVKLHPRKLF